MTESEELELLRLRKKKAMSVAPEEPAEAGESGPLSEMGKFAELAGKFLTEGPDHSKGKFPVKEMTVASNPALMFGPAGGGTVAVKTVGALARRAAPLIGDAAITAGSHLLGGRLGGAILRKIFTK